jgi:hypothetical protein
MPIKASRNLIDRNASLHYNLMIPTRLIPLARTFLRQNSTGFGGTGKQVGPISTPASKKPWP